MALQPDDEEILPIPNSTNRLDFPILQASEPIHAPDVKSPGVKWKPLLNDSLRFLVIENTYRYATEAATRDPDLPYFRGYLNSVASLHGWSDGDPFYVNYVGHPIQGAVSGYLWVQNDPRYNRAEFGRNSDYWKSRIRAAAFAWAYSEWTEIGPLMSEAAIGNIQAFYPQQGFVDHVATPAIGLGWIIAEDVMDRYLVRFVERKTQNRYVRILVRGGANPARTFANVVGGQAPWARARDHSGDLIAAQPKQLTPKPEEPERRPGVAPFEFAANTYWLVPAVAGSCLGGGATAALRLRLDLQMVLDVNGCKMTQLEKNLTGDSLVYMMGPRWTPVTSRHLVPYAQVLFGGNKLTQELIFPDKKAEVAQAPPCDIPGCAHDRYTQKFETNGFAMSAGVGLDIQFNRALALRLGGVEYTRSWTRDLNGFPSPHGIQMKASLVLHMGNW